MCHSERFCKLALSEVEWVEESIDLSTPLRFAQDDKEHHHTQPSDNNKRTNHEYLIIFILKML